jgi:hypothetical protein
MEVVPIRVIDDNPILDGIEGKLKAMKKRIKKTDN